MPRMLDRAAGRHARHEFAGSGYVLGRFRCPAGDARWGGLDWIGEWPHVVLPETPVRIGPSDGRARTAHGQRGGRVRRVTPTTARVAVSTDGDRCAFIAVEPALADELDLASGRPGVRHAPADPRAFLGLHRARAALRGWRPRSAGRGRGAARGHRARGAPYRPRLGGRSRRTPAPPWSTTVREILASAPARRWTLAELGRRALLAVLPGPDVPPAHRLPRSRRTGGSCVCGRPCPGRCGPGRTSRGSPPTTASAATATTRPAFRKHFGCTPSQARGTALRCRGRRPCCRPRPRRAGRPGRRG